MTTELATREPIAECQTAPLETSRYIFRRLQPCDATGVVDCVRAIYGETYVHPEMYSAAEIIRRNQTEQLISIVALDDAGQVVGHYALERPDLTAVAESGVALVLPEHRHHLLMESMRVLLEQEATRLNLLGIWGHAVTNHLFTQHVVEKFGECPCAVSLGWGSRAFHNMDAPLTQRMSELLYFKYLGREPQNRPEQVIAYIPAQHREMCQNIYQQLNVRPRTTHAEAMPLFGRMNIELRADLGRAVLRVQTLGVDTAAEIERTLHELQNTGVEAAFLELPLAQSGTPSACNAAEALGFFFSGIGPSFAIDGDVLRLQWLATPIDVELMQVERPFAKQLVAYVAVEQARARR